MSKSPCPRLSTNGLGLRLTGKQLLADINVRIDTPGVTMVMGPNGAGKSLFVQTLHGLIPPTEGEILIQDRPHDVSQIPQAMVFQKPTLLRRNCEDNLRFAAPHASRDDIDESLRAVQLTTKATEPARRLSGGEQQRLALARALLTQPQVLFLDEPTASLDPASVQIIERLIQNAATRGVNVLFISHDISQSKRLASDVLFIHRGRITEHTDAQTFFTHPASEPAQHYLAGELVL
jgi:tungstate transport system ATP-binding protein